MSLGMRSRVRRLKLLLIVVGLIAFGCVPIPKRFTKSEGLGTYEAQYPFGVETIELRADHYEQRFIDSSGRIFTATGRWKFDPAASRNQGALDHAMTVCDAFGKFRSTVPQPGWRALTFGWYRGTVISVNEDLGLRMRKIN